MRKRRAGSEPHLSAHFLSVSGEVEGGKALKAQLAEMAMMSTPFWKGGPPPMRTVEPCRSRTTVLMRDFPPVSRRWMVRLSCPAWIAVGMISSARLSGSAARYACFSSAHPFGASKS